MNRTYGEIEKQKNLDNNLVLYYTGFQVDQSTKRNLLTRHRKEDNYGIKKFINTVITSKYIGERIILGKCWTTI